MTVGAILKRGFLALALLLIGVSAGPAVAQSVGPSDQLTEQQIVDAFQKAGLPVNNLHQEAVYGTPSGPPMTERSAWRFSIPEVAPSGGKIMIFDSTVKRSHKEAWFQSVKASNIVVRKNVILWLDPGLKGTRVAAYRKVLVSL